MKRRYKAGDWLRVPLGGEHDALAIIARACRSRLFGYFFAVPAAHTPAHDELRRLRPQDAIAVLLFGGSPIEHARWQVVARSLPFEHDAWPFPAFASRGAFGDAWTHVRYDPQTLQIVERRGVDREAAAELPDARFAGAREAETLLRGRIAGAPAPRAQSICEVRSPVDMERVRALEHGGRIQFSTPLSAPDLEEIASFIEAHPHVALRVHGFRQGLDAAALAGFSALRELTLDVHRLQHPSALRELRALRMLRIGAMQVNLEFLDALTGLRSLELHGTRAALDPVGRLPALESLTLENTQPLDPRSLACAQTVLTLELAHGQYDVRGLEALVNLRRLRLVALDARQVPPLRALAHLEQLELVELTDVTDLRPIAHLHALRDLRIAGMPQLNVSDFEPIRACAGLRSLDIDIGSRRKAREVYRLQGRSGRRAPGTCGRDPDEAS